MLSVPEALSFLNQPAPRVLVLPTAELRESLRELTTNAIMVRATGIDTVQFKRWDLTAVVKR
jgi:hypothetical protein